MDIFFMCLSLRDEKEFRSWQFLNDNVCRKFNNILTDIPNPFAIYKQFYSIKKFLKQNLNGTHCLVLLPLKFWK